MAAESMLLHGFDGPVRGRQADIAGITMRWVEQGGGTPVVLVHGIPTSPVLWRHVMSRLGGAHVLAWEMVGYGTSIAEAAGRDISVRAQAGYLAGWMAELDLGRAVLVGHDLGGGVVQNLAVSNPQRCAALLLTNAIGYDSWPIPSVKMLRVMAPIVRRLPNAVVRSAIFGMLMARGHDNAAMARESMSLHWERYAGHEAGKALIRQIESLDVRDTLLIADRLASLNVPARIVWGESDPFQKIEYGRRFARDLQAPLTTIAGGRHFTPEDHAQAIADGIRSLLAELDPRAPASPGPEMT